LSQYLSPWSYQALTLVSTRSGDRSYRDALRCGVRFRIQKAVQRFFRALFHHLVKVIPDLPSSILMIF
jgi:hypothetical protein